MKTILASLAETPHQLAAVVHDLSAPDLAWIPPEGPWAIVQHLCHVRDLEAEGFSVRIRRILTETNPTLPDIDGEKLAIERDYIRQDAGAALREFALERGRTVAGVRTLPADTLTRRGNLETVGSLTFADLLERMLHHDREHLETITGIARRIRE